MVSIQREGRSALEPRDQALVLKYRRMAGGLAFRLLRQPEEDRGDPTAWREERREAEQEATLSLVEAARRYDHECGLPFPCLARWHLRTARRRYFARSAWRKHELIGLHYPQHLEAVEPRIEDWLDAARALERACRQLGAFASALVGRVLIGGETPAAIARDYQMPLAKVLRRIRALEAELLDLEGTGRAQPPLRSRSGAVFAPLKGKPEKNCAEGRGP